MKNMLIIVIFFGEIIALACLASSLLFSANAMQQIYYVALALSVVVLPYCAMRAADSWGTREVKVVQDGPQAAPSGPRPLNEE